MSPLHLPEQKQEGEEEDIGQGASKRLENRKVSRDKTRNYSMYLYVPLKLSIFPRCWHGFVIIIMFTRRIIIIIINNNMEEVEVPVLETTPLTAAMPVPQL
eukprot:4702396-Amphidinium_carterae.1